MRGLFFAVLTASTLSIAPAIADEVKTSPWQGPYAGANIGYGWGSAGSTELSFDTTDHADFDGFITDARAAGFYPTSFAPAVNGPFGGIQLGYNWQSDANWFFGLEGDVQTGGIRGVDSEHRTPAFFDETQATTTESVDWFGTFRGRAGIVTNNNWLLYVTGGLSVGQTSLRLQVTDTSFPCQLGATICADGSSTSVNLGWVAGAGVETMLASNVSLKAEYLYLDLGTRSPTFNSNTTPIVFTPTAHFAEQTVRVGLNYHFD